MGGLYNYMNYFLHKEVEYEYWREIGLPAIVDIGIFFNEYEVYEQFSDRYSASDAARCFSMAAYCMYGREVTHESNQITFYSDTLSIVHLDEQIANLQMISKALEGDVVGQVVINNGQRGVYLKNLELLTTLRENITCKKLHECNDVDFVERAEKITRQYKERGGTYGSLPRVFSGGRSLYQSILSEN
jgi:hypothetical protein